MLKNLKSSINLSACFRSDCRICRILVALLVLICGFEKSILCAFEYNGVNFNVLSSTTCEIGRRDAYDARSYIDIDSIVSYNGKDYRVVAVGDRAFESAVDLERITLPKSVVRIGSKAFYGCKKLKTVPLNEGIEEIGDLAFYKCDRFSSVIVPNTVVNLGEDAFYDCANLERIQFSSSMEIIPKGVCLNNVKLVEVKIPENIKRIEDNAFMKCSKLASIDLPDGVSYLGVCAFFDCTSLTEINFPAELSILGSGCFSNTKIGYEIVIPDKVRIIANNCFSGCTRLNRVTIGSGVESIGDNAFYGCKNIRQLTIKDSDMPLELGYSSFHGPLLGMFSDSPLTTLYLGRDLINEIPYGETTANYSPFSCEYDESRLEDVTLGDNVTEIMINMFKDCNKIAEIHIPSSVVRIKDSAFSGCSGLKAVTGMENVENIGYESFANCRSLESFTFTPSMKDVASRSFSGCVSLSTVIFEDTDSEITLGNNRSDESGNPQGLFGDCNLEKLYLGRNYGSIIENVSPFGGQTKLSEVTVGEKVTIIQSYFVSGAISLTALSLPSSLKEIGQFAFYDCKTLSTVKLNESLLSIGASAFNHCESLNEINIPSSVKVLPDAIFANCLSLPAIVLPEGLESIGQAAFSKCGSLTEVNIPSSVKAIPPFAFAGCISLPGIYLHDAVESIGESAFKHCQALESINLPEKVKGIPEAAFADCTLLPAINMHDEIASIGRSAFSNCVSLSGIYIPKKVEMLYEDTFEGCTGLSIMEIGASDRTLTIETASDDVELFRQLSLSSIVIGRNITGPDEKMVYHPFRYNGTLEYVTVAGDVEKIGKEMFRDCRLLKTLALGDKVKCVEDSAFLNCVSLHEVGIPVHTDRIGTSAFEGCSGLKRIIADATEEPLILEYRVFEGVGDIEYMYMGRNVVYKGKGSWSDEALFPMQTQLREIEIGNKVNEIRSLFTGCNVGEIKSHALQPPYVSERSVCLNARYGSDPRAVLQIPEESYEAYSEALGWREFPLFDIAGIRIPSSIELVYGQTYQLEAEVIPHYARKDDLAWESSSKLVAVDADGVVTVGSGEGYGLVTAYVSYDRNIAASCVVSVVSPKTQEIVLDPSAINMYVGDKVQIYATLKPIMDYGKTIMWTSSSPSVASVDEWGMVEGIGSGEAVITAMCDGVAATCVVSVEERQVTLIVLNENELKLKLGESYMLKATVSPENAVDKTVRWYSDNTDVAIVDSDGKVSAISFGNALISAKCGKALASCRVTVEKTPVEMIELNHTKVALKVGESIDLQADVYPEDATDKSIRWQSSDESVVIVDEDGKVKALSVGLAYVSAASGTITATCTVIVEKAAEIQCTSLTLSETEITLMKGKSFDLVAYVLPENATNKNIEWSSSNNMIAEVDANGMVMAYGIEVGEVIITAKTTDGSDLHASCKVTVVPKPVESLELSILSWTGHVGDQFSITATALPADADFNKISWSIEGSTDVVVFDWDSELDNYGQSTVKLTAKNTGSVMIWASTGYPEERRVGCLVIVEPILVESLTITPETWLGDIVSFFFINALILPENATDKTLEYESSDISVATVDEEGLVAVIGEGSCVITVSTVDGSNLTAACQITGISGVESLFEESEGEMDIYTPMGIIVKKNCTLDDLGRLTPGLYIIRKGNIAKTIYLTGRP